MNAVVRALRTIRWTGVLAAVFAMLVTADPARSDAEPLPAGNAPTAPQERAVHAATLVRAEERLAVHFDDASMPYPPSAITLVVLKREARLELWAHAGEERAFVRSYLIRASSGHLGPKLVQGDHQVPEGVYRIVGLNPRSKFHLSMRLGYPNRFDRARAIEDGRFNLGGDIMIHGGRVSDGCLAVGDSAAEELYALAARIGHDKVTVLISPLDLRHAPVAVALARIAGAPPWVPVLYDQIAAALRGFPLPIEDASPHAGGSLSVEATKCKSYDEADCASHCSEGDLASCARAGLMYRDGRGAVANRKLAWSLLRHACAGSDALGCAELGRLYLEDDGVMRNAARAHTLVRAACESGNGQGCSYLAEMCLDHILYSDAQRDCDPATIERLRYRAFELLEKDCEGWGAYDCNELAKLYVVGDTVTAVRFASGACEGGDPEGCYQLARLYEGKAEIWLARNLYQRACDAGFAPACRHAPLGGLALLR